MPRLALAFLFAALPACAPFAATAATWQAATEYPATAMPGEGLSGFAVAVAQRTAGALTVVPGFDGPGGLRSATIPAAVRDGRLQVGDSFAGSLAGLDPVFQLSSLPFLATNEAEVRRLLEAARPSYDRAFAALGQRLLYVTPWPATGLWSRDRVDGAAGLRGLAVRTYDAAGTDALRRAGAQPTEISFADAMPRLRDGSVQAVLSSGDGGAGRRLWEYTPWFTEIGYAMPLSFATVGQAAYDALDPAQRVAVDAAAAETEAAQWHRLADRTAANYDRMRQNGVHIVPPAPDLLAALRDAAAGSLAAWRQQAGAEGAAILARYGQASR